MKRAALLAFAFVAAMVAVPGGAYFLMDALEVPEPAIKLEYVKEVARVAEAIPPPSSRSGKLVLVFGDSLVAGFGPARKIPDRLRQRFALDRDPPVYVGSLAMPATSAFDYYFLADLLLPTKPDAVVFFLNLASFSEDWRRLLLKPQLVGWVSSERWVSALRQPLAWLGLTWDQILFYQTIVHSGLSDLWMRASLQQARIAVLRKRLESDLLHTTSREAERRARDLRALAIMRSTMEPGRKRFTRERTFRHLSGVASGLRPGHPMLRILAETVRLFRAQGSAVLVCVMPINVEQAVAIGAVEDAGIRSSIDVIRYAVVSAGGDLVDLHATFPDAAFRDAAGHLRDDDDFDAAGRVAEVVEVMVRSELSGRGTP